MKSPVVLIGIGEMGGVFARGFLRAGYPVYPVTRQTDLAEAVDALLAQPTHGFDYRPIPRFPSVKVDVALALPEEVPAGDVARIIERSGKGLVASIELFARHVRPPFQQPFDLAG